MTSKHISEFKPAQVLQIINWGREHCKLPAKIMEDDLTLIRTEVVNGKEYIREVSVAGIVINPIKLNP